jgi:hypothetical protein
MRVTAWLLIVFAVGSSFADRLEAQAENAPPTLSITGIVASPIATVGSEITVAIVLQNKSGRTIKEYVPAESSGYGYTMSVLDEAGKRPPLTWTGRNVIDHDPSVTVSRPHVANRELADGDVITQKLVISQFFDFSKPGKYTIQISQGEGKTASKSNTVTVKVVP